MVWLCFKDRLENRVCSNPHRAMASLGSIWWEMKSEEWRSLARLFWTCLGNPDMTGLGERLGSSDKGICFPEIFLEDHIYVLYTHITYVGLKLVSELQPYCNIFDFLEEISWFLRLENPLTCWMFAFFSSALPIPPSVSDACAAPAIYLQHSGALEPQPQTCQASRGVWETEFIFLPVSRSRCGPGSRSGSGSPYARLSCSADPWSSLSSARAGGSSHPWPSAQCIMCFLLALKGF